MVSHVYVCAHCDQSARVVRRGFNRNGTQRLQCPECGKTWTPEGKSRRISAEKEALIEKALQERLSQRAIARALSAGRATVQKVLKKSLTSAA